MSNIIALKKETEKQRENTVKGFDAGFDGTLTATKTDLDGALTLINQRIDAQNNPDTLVVNGAKRIAQHAQLGEEVSLTAIIQQIANENAAYSYRLLADKSKKLLIEAGVLIKINATKYQWANLQNTTETVTDEPIAATPVQRKKVHLKQTINHLINQYHVFIAKRSPWIEVKADGTLQKYRKPFTGELTTAEKKLLREAAEAKAYAKLLKQNKGLTPAACQLSEQVQLDTIKRQAAHQVQLEKCWLWAKIIGFIAAVIFILNSIGTGSATSDQLPNGIQGAYSDE